MRILVVEDEPLLREVLVDIVEMHGHEAVACRDGIEALVALLIGPEPGLVITDVQMPRCNGAELVHAIGEALRAVPVVVITGQASDDQMRMIERSAARVLRILRKPFEIAAVLDLIEQAAGEVREAAAA